MPFRNLQSWFYPRARKYWIISNLCGQCHIFSILRTLLEFIWWPKWLHFLSSIWLLVSSYKFPNLLCHNTLVSNKSYFLSHRTRGSEWYFCAWSTSWWWLLKPIEISTFNYYWFSLCRDTLLRIFWESTFNHLLSQLNRRQKNFLPRSVPWEYNWRLFCKTSLLFTLSMKIIFFNLNMEIIQI